jgi:hypothetical protein
VASATAVVVDDKHDNAKPTLAFACAMDRDFALPKNRRSIPTEECVLHLLLG